MPIPVSALRLLFTLLVGASLLCACGKESNASLVADAKAKLAAGDVTSAMIQFKNAVEEDEKNPRHGLNWAISTWMRVIRQGRIRSSGAPVKRAILRARPIR